MPYRIIQWATGAVGALCLEEILRNPGLELAGVYVYNPDKVGKDAGDLYPAFIGTMATVVNAITDVCAAEPGILHAPIFAPWSPSETVRETAHA